MGGWEGFPPIYLEGSSSFLIFVNLKKKGEYLKKIGGWGGFPPIFPVVPSRAPIIVNLKVFG